MKRLQRRAVGFAAAGSAAAVAFTLAASVVAARSSEPNLALIGGVMQLVRQDYVHPIDSDQLTRDALKGMLARLDPHSSYMTEQELRESQQDMNGKFGGVGMEIADRQGLPTVISPIDATPAGEAGLQPGDIITSVDGKATPGMGLMQIVREIRGKPGTSVTLSISRGSQTPFDVSLTRRIILVHSVKSKLEPGDIGYVRITEFTQNTPAELKQAIATLKRGAAGNLKGLVLDLREDPGGLLSSAVGVSGDFLDGGTVVSIRGRQNSDDQTFRAPAKGDLLPGTPMTVLINGASASASEIVAGALQDRHRATVIGTESFGKGSVQSIITLNGDGALRLTTALYYTPSGRSIQDVGITPDIVVAAPKDEQVANSLIWRESQLHGAFRNPGPVARSDTLTHQMHAESRTYSPPIKEQLIGTAKDTQLAAALDFLKSPDGVKSPGRNRPEEI
jgi:carboxyl-terminal processing protease